MRIAFLTCHLTGTGHLVRTLALADALEAAGAQPSVISGGITPPHLAPVAAGRLVELPALHVPDFDYANPHGADGQPADAALFAARGRAIAETLSTVRPDVFVTETYPFGRRRLSAEYEAAIAAARAANPRVRIVASVRDVPEPPKRAERLAEAATRLRAFDRVLVHGEEALVPLAASWPMPDGLLPMIRHTGYVGAQTSETAPRGGEILVSVGGGLLGRALLDRAIEAARLSDRPWRLLVGGPDAVEIARRLGTGAPDRVTVEPARRDYRRLLAGAAASVSLAGYNTAMDLAGVETPALLVPFEERGEREQRIRADLLARFAGIETASLGDLTAEALARRAECLAEGPRRARLPIAADGAARAAAELIGLAA
ncbi:MAG: glycosyltransferase family protein [Paracoccaceae bacterium]